MTTFVYGAALFTSSSIYVGSGTLVQSAPALSIHIPETDENLITRKVSRISSRSSNKYRGIVAYNKDCRQYRNFREWECRSKHLN